MKKESEKDVKEKKKIGEDPHDKGNADAQCRVVIEWIEEEPQSVGE